LVFSAVSNVVESKFDQCSRRPQTPPPSFATWGVIISTPFSCRYIRRDIMCKHDVMNIQHAHCGIVGPDRGVRKVGPSL